MSNLIAFQTRASGHAHGVAAAFLRDPEPHSHAVQFYESDEYLVQTVARFLAAGLSAGDRILVVATQAHAKPSWRGWGTGLKLKWDDRPLGDVARRAVRKAGWSFLLTTIRLMKHRATFHPRPRSGWIGW